MTVSALDYDYLRQLLRRTSANKLDPGKEYLVVSKLGPLAEERGCDSIAALLAAVRAGDTALQEAVVDAMTNNETSFFRDAHPFEALRSTVIPELLGHGSRSLAFWSAAASTGQEAYSLALLMNEHFRLSPRPTILGTDLSATALKKARAGEYSQLEVNRGLPAPMLVRDFEQDGRRWRIKDDVRRMVQFRQMNLLESWRGVPQMDLIVLRNVLIYFDVRTREDVLGRVVQQLRPGGYLLLGGTESMMLDTMGLERITVGRRSVFFRLPRTQGASP